MKRLASLIGFLLIGSLTACSPSQVLNPYYETPSEHAVSGKSNDHALYGETDKTDSARQAFDQMASYRRAMSPQPVNPVIQPAVVRLMWVPDHLNSHGDLVPAHYYYLKVLQDRFAVQDAFELESQLGSKKLAQPYLSYTEEVMQGSRIISITLALLSLSFVGCSYKQESVDIPRVYKLTTRKWAPEQVYNRLRWVRPPQVSPQREMPITVAPSILPVVHFTVEEETLKDAVLILGANTRYKTYCSPSIEAEKLSMDMLGTIEEIAVAIEDSKNIQVIVDHEAAELRFEPRRI